METENIRLYKIMLPDKRKEWIPESTYGSVHSVSILKNGKIQYFWYGIGKEVVKPITTSNIELPESSIGNIKEVCRVLNEYGEAVAFLFIVNNAQAWRFNYLRKCNMLLNSIDIESLQSLPIEFLNCIRIDYRLSVLGYTMFDINETDRALSEADAEYDNILATYKGVACSMKQYIELKYGIESVRAIENIISNV